MGKDADREGVLDDSPAWGRFHRKVIRLLVRMDYLAIHVAKRRGPVNQNVLERYGRLDYRKM